jgi:predicted 3-demethylubiquinone-9 3-methyltransferase (glyoxalase superfamily)
MQKITPFLWFDKEAEEAANYYVSIFRNSKVLKVVRYGPAGPGAEGTVMTVAFELDGQEFTALNGGPQFRFSEAISFVVRCATQPEIDALWARLADGGREGRCGWVQDRYGLWWQVVPADLPELLADKDPVGARRAMQAMLGMGKLDIGALRRALRGS